MDHQAIVPQAHVLLACGERADEAEFLGVLGDVDKAPRAHHPPVEAGGVHVAVPVHLGKAQHRHVQGAAIVELEGIRHPVHGLWIHRSAKLHPPQRDAPNGATLHRDGEKV